MWRKLAVTALICAASTPLMAAPQQLQLEFDLLQQGAVIAKVSEQLTVKGKQYTLRSTTRGKGFYRLMGERTLSSQGAIVGGRLRPMHFEVQQSKRPEKALINDFDWAKKVLNMQVKGEARTATLSNGTQDLLSVMYCWMWQPPTGKQVELDVSNGKKLSSYQFKVSEESQPLQTGAGNFRVIKLTDSDGEKTVYLAKDQGYLPVKIVLEDDGKRMEQVLKAVSGK